MKSSGLARRHRVTMAVVPRMVPRWCAVGRTSTPRRAGCWPCRCCPRRIRTLPSPSPAERRPRHRRRRRRPTPRRAPRRDRAREGQLRGGVPIAPRRRPSLGRPPPSTRQRRHPRPPLRCAPLADARRSFRPPRRARRRRRRTPSRRSSSSRLRFTDSSRRSSPGLDLRVARPLREGSDARVKPAGALGDMRALEGTDARGVRRRARSSYCVGGEDSLAETMRPTTWLLRIARTWTREGKAISNVALRNSALFSDYKHMDEVSDPRTLGRIVVDRRSRKISERVQIHLARASTRLDREEKGACTRPPFARSGEPRVPPRRRPPPPLRRDPASAASRRRRRRPRLVSREPRTRETRWVASPARARPPSRRAPPATRTAAPALRPASWARRTSSSRRWALPRPHRHDLGRVQVPLFRLLRGGRCRRCLLDGQSRRTHGQGRRLPRPHRHDSW